MAIIQASILNLNTKMLSLKKKPSVNIKAGLAKHRYILVVSYIVLNVCNAFEFQKMYGFHEQMRANMKKAIISEVQQLICNDIH